jgi:hypothetical protein
MERRDLRQRPNAPLSVPPLLEVLPPLARDRDLALGDLRRALREDVKEDQQPDAKETVLWPRSAATLDLRVRLQGFCRSSGKKRDLLPEMRRASMRGSSTGCEVRATSLVAYGCESGAVDPRARSRPRRSAPSATEHPARFRAPGGPREGCRMSGAIALAPRERRDTRCWSRVLRVGLDCFNPPRTLVGNMFRTAYTIIRGLRIS